MTATEPRTLHKALPNALDGVKVVDSAQGPEGEIGARAGDQLARLHAWLADHPTWSDIALSGTERWVELILRFRFTRLPT
jgi:hypothetical protein